MSRIHEVNDGTILPTPEVLQKMANGQGYQIIPDSQLQEFRDVYPRESLNMWLSKKNKRVKSTFFLRNSLQMSEWYSRKIGESLKIFQKWRKHFFHSLLLLNVSKCSHTIIIPGSHVRRSPPLWVPLPGGLEQTRPNGAPDWGHGQL